MKEFQKAVIEIIKTGHWITDSITRELKEYGIYEPQFNVLLILKAANGQPISVNSILENMVQRSSNVTRIVDKLESKGLVDRQLCGNDRRKMDIVITNEGKRLLTKMEKKVTELHKPMFNNLNTKELKTLAHLINKLKGKRK